MSQKQAHRLKAKAKALQKEEVSSEEEDFSENVKPTKKVKKTTETPVPNLVAKKPNKVSIQALEKTLNNWIETCRHGV